MPRWTVEVTGLRQLMNALEATDKKAAKTVVSEITKAGRAVASEAGKASPTAFPVSNWGTWNATTARGASRDLGFDPAKVAKGFKVRRNNFRRRRVSAGIGWSVQQSNPGGSIFEVIGDGSRVTTSSGAALVAAINERFPGRRPRSLFGAYYRVITPELRDRIRDTIIAEARKAGLR